MQMKNGLPCFCIGVDDRPVPCPVDALLLSQSSHYREQMSKQFLIGFEIVIQGRDVFAGDDQQVDRSLGIDIPKSQAVLVLVHNCCGFLVIGDLAENTPEHFHHPFLVSIEQQLLDRKGKHGQWTRSILAPSRASFSSIR